MGYHEQGYYYDCQEERGLFPISFFNSNLKLGTLLVLVREEPNLR